MHWRLKRKKKKKNRFFSYKYYNSNEYSLFVFRIVHALWFFFFLLYTHHDIPRKENYMDQDRTAYCISHSEYISLGRRSFRVRTKNKNLVKFTFTFVSFKFKKI